jgi:DNA-binding transcriptional LysR family regulator
VLKVAMPADFAIFFLSEAITSFMSAFPSVSLEINTSTQLVDMVAERFDLAIRLGSLPDSNLVAKPLPTLTRHFYASKHFLTKNGTPHSLAELAELPFIFLQSQAASSSQLTLPLDKGPQVFTPKSVIKTNSIGLTRSLAMAGAGIAVLPDIMTQAPLTQVLGHIALSSAQAHFVMAQRQWLPAKTRAFIDHVQRWCERARA